jgi:hypothetical protein
MADSLATLAPELTKGNGCAFSSRVRPHALVREARCLLCGAVHKEFYVGVVLCEGDEALGDVCPRCLSEPPDRCARRVWGRASRLWAEVGAGLTREGFPPQEEAAEERQRRAEDRRRRERERRRRLAGPVSAVPEPKAVTQAEKEHLAELLLTLAEGVGRLREWPTPPAAVQEAERQAIQARHPEFPPGVLRRFVHARYGEPATDSQLNAPRM